MPVYSLHIQVFHSVSAVVIKMPEGLWLSEAHSSFMFYCVTFNTPVIPH